MHSGASKEMHTNVSPGLYPIADLVVQQHPSERPLDTVLADIVGKKA